jgi:putative CocE/NonD family hydrolase
MLGPRSGIALQNDVERRPDVLVYTTPPLAGDLEVTGPVKLILYASTTARSTDFTSKLVDVYPDGRAYNVSDGIRRVVLAPGRATRVGLDLWPTSMLFRKGHRIRLEISSSNYPRFDRNPNTGGNIAIETRPVSATQTVYHGARIPSRIILPIVPR